MGRFARDTDVPVERTRAEIEVTLKKYGAKSFGYMWSDDDAQVAFEANGKRIRFELTMPPLSEFTTTPTRRFRRSQSAMLAAHDQECRRKWRALLLVIKAKLEAVESGITTFEAEFLPFIVLPNGHTVGEALLPRIDELYEKGLVPGMLSIPERAGGQGSA